MIIEDNVFIGHGVTFINDSYPRATTAGWAAADRKGLASRTDRNKAGASIGSGVHDSFERGRLAKMPSWAQAVW